MYIDTSIRFNSNEITPILETSNDVGILTRYIQTPFLCYTDKRMFSWFNENVEQYSEYNSAEANFIIVNNGLVSSLIMKAWVTCALDESCIAPKNSHIYGNARNWLFGCQVCGCHRFDQAALTIVNGFFFGVPNNIQKYPAYALTPSENAIFEIQRRTISKYIKDQLNIWF